MSRNMSLNFYIDNQCMLRLLIEQITILLQNTTG